jgi:hypothetical protein
MRLFGFEYFPFSIAHCRSTETITANLFFTIGRTNLTGYLTLTILLTKYRFLRFVAQSFGHFRDIN